MKLGLSAFAWTFAFEEADLNLLPFVRGCGYEAFELPMFAPSALADSAKIRRAFEANDLACTVCAILPPGINPVDPDPAVRMEARRHLAACIMKTAEMGATVMGGPVFAPIGYLPGHRPSNGELEWVVEMLQSLTPILDATGVTLAIEPVSRAETFLVRTVQTAAEICARVRHPLVGVMIDTFHANIEEKSVVGAFAGLGPLLKHVHASENDRGILGQGHIDFRAMLAVLKHGQFSGYVMVEGFGYPLDGRNSPGALWADYPNTPEKLARESYTHLQGLLSNL